MFPLSPLTFVKSTRKLFGLCELREKLNLLVADIASRYGSAVRIGEALYAKQYLNCSYRQPQTVKAREITGI